MVVLILENVPSSLRGELTRWLLEPKAGVFIGTVSAMVREKLWKKVCNKSKDGGCILLHNTNNEQGFAVHFWGNNKRRVKEFEGLCLIEILRNK